MDELDVVFLRSDQKQKQTPAQQAELQQLRQSKADADDAREASEADRRTCMALESKCRELGASDVDVAAARVPRRTVLETVRAHREVCGLICALVVLLDPAPLRVGIGLGALGVLALM